MNDRMQDLDWSYIRSFVAVADTGSLSAAARRLQQSQPTLGRHIKAAEAALGAELFVRSAAGFTLTDFGLALLPHAQQMAEASARLQTMAAGQDHQLAGTVRLTASVVVSNYILPRIIADIRSKEPEIEIELVPSDASENLLYREADIAVRMYRPTQLDMITRHLGDQPIALYATPELLEKTGQPQTLEDLGALPFVGFDRSDMIIRAMREMSFPVDRHFFGVRCDDQAVYWQLICAGCGVGAMQTVIGDADPRVTRLAFQPALPALPVWLVAPDALRTNARIKRVWDLLAQKLPGATDASRP